MTHLNPLLLYLGGGLIGVSAFVLGRELAGQLRLAPRLAARRERLERELHDLHKPAVAGSILAGQAAVLAAALAAASLIGSAWPFLLAPLAVIGPDLWLARQRAAYVSAIEQQLEGFLLALSNALRASPSLGDAIAASSELVPAPLCHELARVVREQRLGVGLDRALAHLAGRVQSPVVTAAIAILKVARVSGGDLHRTLEAAAASLREMARLEGVLRTKTAEGRAQAAVIAAAPLVLIGLLQVLAPRFLAPLASTSTGQLVIAAALLLWVSALLLARLILAVDL